MRFVTITATLGTDEMSAPRPLQINSDRVEAIRDTASGVEVIMGSNTYVVANKSLSEVTNLITGYAPSPPAPAQEKPVQQSNKPAYSPQPKSTYRK